MDIETFMENFSDKKRITYSRQKLSVKAQGKWYLDLIVAIMFLSFIGLSIRVYVLGLDSTASAIALPAIFFVVVLYKTRGDNNIEIDAINKKIKLRRRSPFLFFMPKQTLYFSNIKNSRIEERITYGRPTSFTSYCIVVEKKQGINKNTTLMSFLQDEKNNAAQLLSLLKFI